MEYLNPSRAVAWAGFLPQGRPGPPFGEGEQYHLKTVEKVLLNINDNNTGFR
jgi:hypothetical protein